MAPILEAARAGTMTKAIRRTAAQEGVDPKVLLICITEGSAVIMHRGDHYVGIGKGLRTKVNVNIGTSSSRISLQEEVEKVLVAERYGADTITDLSMGGDLPMIRNTLFGATSMPVTRRSWSMVKMSSGLLIAIVSRLSLRAMGSAR